MSGLRRVVTGVELLAVLATVVFVVLLFTKEADSPDAAADGAELYVSASCASCHGANGEGSVGPALGGGAVVEAYPEVADQVAVVTDGQGAMPAFGGDLTAEQIEAVVAYTRSDALTG